MFPKECVNLTCKGCGIVSPTINLHFVKAKRTGQFVFTYEVYFVLALSVPPAAYPRIVACRQQLCLEVLLKRRAGKYVEIPFDDLQEAWQKLLRDRKHSIGGLFLDDM